MNVTTADGTKPARNGTPTPSSAHAKYSDPSAPSQTGIQYTQYESAKGNNTAANQRATADVMRPISRAATAEITAAPLNYQTIPFYDLTKSLHPRLPHLTSFIGVRPVTWIGADHLIPFHREFAAHISRSLLPGFWTVWLRKNEEGIPFAVLESALQKPF